MTTLPNDYASKEWLRPVRPPLRRRMFNAAVRVGIFVTLFVAGFLMMHPKLLP
jgi:hypothetical protein